MTKTNTPPAKTPSETEAEPQQKQEETPFEAAASICSVLVVGLFILTFLAQNFVIPSGSMENTLLVGDHLVVDRITLAPPTKWMPLVHYREPQRGDIVVFIKPGRIGRRGQANHPVPGQAPYQGARRSYPFTQRDQIVNGVAQSQPHAQPTTPENFTEFLDEFPSVPYPIRRPGEPPSDGAVDFPNHVVDGDLVVPPGKFFMMGDHRHDSLDSRFWGFVPRENIVGRPLFNYWSFKNTRAPVRRDRHRQQYRVDWSRGAAFLH